MSLLPFLKCYIPPTLALIFNQLKQETMSLLKTVNESEAIGFIENVYSTFTQNFDKVPNVVKFHTASTVLFQKLMDFINHSQGHATLNPVLMAYTRLVISHYYKGEYCVRLQSALLKMHGVKEKDIEQAKNNILELKLEEKQKSLLLFVFDLTNGNHQNVKQKGYDIIFCGFMFFTSIHVELETSTYSKYLPVSDPAIRNTLNQFM